MAKDPTVKTSKAKRSLRRYTIFHALLVGIVCFVVAAAIGQGIEAGYLKHSFDVLFASAAVGIVITILNFKPLSKLAVVLLPPVYALSGFAVVAGPLVMAQLGIDKASLGDSLSIVVENVPFFLIYSILYRWYSGLARERSFILYMLYAVFTVVISLLIFGDRYPLWLLQSVHLGGGAFLFSLLHLNRVLSNG